MDASGLADHSTTSTRTTSSPMSRGRARISARRAAQRAVRLRSGVWATAAASGPSQPVRGGGAGTGPSARASQPSAGRSPEPSCSPIAGPAQHRVQSPICVGRGGATWLRSRGLPSGSRAARTHCRLTPEGVVRRRPTRLPFGYGWSSPSVAGSEPMLVTCRSSFGCLDRALSGVSVAREHQSEISLLQGEQRRMAPRVRGLVDATPDDLVIVATVPSADRRVRVRGGVEALL